MHDKDDMTSPANNCSSTTLLAPKALYGVAGQVGRFWKRLITIAWNEGWPAALEKIEWIDLAQIDGLILMEEFPHRGLTPHLREQPFYAAYKAHSELSKYARKQFLAKDSSQYFRLRDLTLEAMDWPWYVMGTMSVRIGFLPCADPLFPDRAAWEQELARVHSIALQKFMRHFDMIAALDPRISLNGLFKGSWGDGFFSWMWGVLRHAVPLKMFTDDDHIHRFMRLPLRVAQTYILQRMAEKGLAHL
jgi:hypothetical protein